MPAARKDAFFIGGNTGDACVVGDGHGAGDIAIHIDALLFHGCLLSADDHRCVVPDHQLYRIRGQVNALLCTHQIQCGTAADGQGDRVTARSDRLIRGDDIQAAGAADVDRAGVEITHNTVIIGFNGVFSQQQDIQRGFHVNIAAPVAVEGQGVGGGVIGDGAVTQNVSHVVGSDVIARNRNGNAVQIAADGAVAVLAQHMGQRIHEVIFIAFAADSAGIAGVAH